MSKTAKIAVVASLVVVVAAVIVMKQINASSAPQAPPPADGPPAKPLPTLLEVGSTTCIPCRMMVPILAELRKEYAGQLRVEVADFYADEAIAERHHVRVLPTQIFLDAAGKVIFRHEGFFPKEDILAKWKELGVALEAPGQPTTAGAS